MNRDGFEQTTGSGSSTFPTFGFGDLLQPRVGISVQLRPKKGDKVYANYGRYYGLDQKSGARAVAAGRRHERRGFRFATGVPVSRSLANTGPKAVVPGLQPPVTDEVVAGYATPIGGAWTLDAFAKCAVRSFHRGCAGGPAVLELPVSERSVCVPPISDSDYRSAPAPEEPMVVERQLCLSRLYGNYDRDDSGDFTGALRLARRLSWTTAWAGSAATGSDRCVEPESHARLQGHGHLDAEAAAGTGAPDVRGPDGTPGSARLALGQQRVTACGCSSRRAPTGTLSGRTWTCC
jgi:hypothetical protein